MPSSVSSLSSSLTQEATVVRRVGRYAVAPPFAAGGMASVHIARLVAAHGFSRCVAVKQLHPNMLTDPAFVDMFIDEARIAGRIRHPNVVSTLDVIHEGDALMIALDYVHGESFSNLLRATSRELRATSRWHAILSAVIAGALRGLHAAHTATDEDGELLGIIHRDVSPQNILVDMHGTPRVVDFGVAKAMGRLHITKGDQLKGKAAYMAPEQVTNTNVSCRTDIYAAGVVLWEALTGRSLFTRDHEVAILHAILHEEIKRPSTVVSGITPELDALVMRALARDPQQRFASALEMAEALERVVAPASADEVGKWVVEAAKEPLKRRAELLTYLEKMDLHAADDSNPSFRLTRSLGQVQPASGPSSSSDTTTMSNEVPARGRRSRAPWFVVLSLLVGLGLGVSVALARRAGSSPGGPASAEPSFEVLEPAPRAAPSPSASSASAPSSASPAVAEAPRATLAIVASPTNARIYVDDAPVRANPHEASLPKDGATHHVRVEAPGYVTQTQSVVLDKDARLRVQLVKASPDYRAPTPSPSPTKTVRPIDRTLNLD